MTPSGTDHYLTGAVEGDPSALNELLREIRPQVLALVVSRTRDWDQAEDITQGIMVKVAGNIGRLREPDAFGGWVYRITQNEVYKIRKKEQREGNARTEWAISESSVPQGPGLETVLDRKRVWAAVMDVVEKLPEPQREVFRLTYVDGLRPFEVAGELDKPKGTVRASLCRGRRTVEHLLAARRPRLMEEMTGESRSVRVG